MSALHPLLAKQLERARDVNGVINLNRMWALISETYAEADSDRRRTDHAIRMMIEDLDHRAEHDAMTGLANRVRFSTQLQKAMGAANDPKRAAVLFLDLDRFKEVNDTMGHFAGDELLRIVARRLKDVVGDKGLCARLGGDEFAVVQWDAPDPTAAADLAMTIIDALSQPCRIDDVNVAIGVSVGIALTPDHGRSINDLQRRADMALYRAKQGRRSSFCFFEQEMDDALSSRKALETDMRNALARNQFQLYFQPIVEADTKQVRAYEALIRWIDPVRGFVPPCDFIPLAEANGLIVPIGEWVIRNALAQARRFPEHISVAINISPVQLRAENLVDVFKGALEATGVAPQRVELEITETVLLEDDRRVMAQLAALRALGLRFALDDFGSGYSSLSYLQKFHFDTIKIDRSFCSSVNSNPTNAALVRAMAALGRDLGIDVVAEGVEDSQQSNTLVAEGCGYLQGYHYGRPAAPDAIEGLGDMAVEQMKELLRRMQQASADLERRSGRERREGPRALRTG